MLSTVSRTVAAARSARVAQPSIFVSAVRHMSFLGSEATLDTPIPGINAQKPAEADLLKGKVQTGRAENGMMVVTVETAKPLSSVMYVANAGARYQGEGQDGCAHALRHAAFLSTKNRTNLRIVREFESLGATLGATGNREQLLLSARLVRDHTDLGIETIADEVENAEFRHWELNDVIGRVKHDQQTIAALPESVVIENLYGTAYRQGLSAPMFARDFDIPNINSQSMQAFGSNMRTEGAVLVVVGPEHQNTMAMVNEYFSKTGLSESEKVKSVFRAGESRVHKGAFMTNFALAFEAPQVNAADAAAATVLQYALGAGSRVKWGGEVGSIQNVAKEAAGAGAAVSANAFSAAHTDSGLFGVYGAVEADKAGKVMDAVTGVLQKAKSGSLTDKDVARGVAQAKADLLMRCEHESERVLVMATQAAGGAKDVSPEAVAASYDKVTAADVSNVAKKIFGGKAALSVYGNTKTAPYLEDLKL
eukprot:Clim_evm81s108 gene=Clim_evmTU81s108